MKPKPIAVLTSDIHLSLKQPPCRKDDWMEVQARHLKQLRDIAENEYDVRLPILCAGDVFDRWNPPPEMIQFALKHLPDGMITVPGQHDLPNHRLEEMRRSAYGVLVEAGKIQCASVHRRANALCPSESHVWVSNWKVYGFGWNEEIAPPPYSEGYHTLALIHKFVWTAETSYGPGTPEDSHLAKLAPLLKDYKVAVFGDNHKGFLKKLKNGTTVLNCGGFIRRKSDEVNYEPRVGILRDDGSVVSRKLDVSQDQFRTEEEMEDVVQVDMTDFIEELGKLGEHGLDFKETVRRTVETGIPVSVKEKVLKCLED